MKWDKPNYAKQKQTVEQIRAQADAELGRRVQDFLMGQYRGRIEWPDTSIMLGVVPAEDGEYMYAVFYDNKEQGRGVVACEETLASVLDTATKYFRSKLDEDNKSTKNQ